MPVLTPVGWLVAAIIVAIVLLSLFVGYLMNTPATPPTRVAPPTEDREPIYMMEVHPRRAELNEWHRQNGTTPRPRGRTDRDADR